MKKEYAALLRKDIRLMASGHFFLLALISLLFYTCYIQMVYVKTDQAVFPVYFYNPAAAAVPAGTEETASLEELKWESICGEEPPQSIWKAAEAGSWMKCGRLMRSPCLQGNARVLHR